MHMKAMSNSLKKEWLYAGAILLMVMFFSAHVLHAATATLSWDPPASSADGSDLTDLEGYVIYVGFSPDDYTQYIDVGNVTTYVLSDLVYDLTYHVAVTAYDTSGNESDYSSPASITIASVSTPPSGGSGAGHPEITSHAPDSTLSGSTETFAWTDNGTAVSAWGLDVGSMLGGGDIFCGGGSCNPSQDQNTVMDVSGLPTDGSIVYVRLWYNTESWQFVDFQYSAATATVPYGAPEITVTDSVKPPKDLQVPFGDITEFNSSEKTITVKNNGDGDLDMGDIILTDSLSPFSVYNDGCSLQNVAPAGSCSLTVRFSPNTTGSFSEMLTIPSNDSDESMTTVALSGAGLSSATNNPPSEPELVSPKNRGKGGGKKETFTCKKSTDPDGDTVTYDLTVCQDPDMTTGCETQTTIASIKSQDIFYAGVGSFSAGMLLFGMIFTLPFRRKETKRVPLTVIILLLAAMFLLASCGGGGSGGTGESGSGVTLSNGIDGTDEVSQEVSGLTGNRTYYWQVVARDDSGAETYSSVWSFETP
jgi:hypothetical protein